MPAHATKTITAAQGSRPNSMAAEARRLGLEPPKLVGNRFEVSLNRVDDFDNAVWFLREQARFKYDSDKKVWFTKNRDFAAALWPELAYKPLTGKPFVFKYQAPLQPAFIRYAKVMANFPLARGPRCQAQWHTNRDGSATAQLPGERKVELHLKPGPRRCPTAFDENFKLMLLALSRMHNSPALVFPTYRGLLTMLGYSKGKYGNVAQVKGALDYLSRLSIHIAYGNETHVLPPLIEECERNEAGLCIRINEQFYRMALGIGQPPAELPLPLPKGFATQNLLMLVAATRWTVNSDEDGTNPWRTRPAVPRAVLARKAGLNHSMRNRDLMRALREVAVLYKEHGAELVAVSSGDGLVFMVQGKMRFGGTLDAEDAAGGSGTVPMVRERLHAAPSLPPQPPPNVSTARRAGWREVRAHDDDGRVCTMWVHEDGRISDQPPGPTSRPYPT